MNGNGIRTVMPIHYFQTCLSNNNNARPGYPVSSILSIHTLSAVIAIIEASILSTVLNSYP
jgi:hypothetical protein